MDVQAKLAEIREQVASARSMPMSASAVVHRADLLGALDELAQMLPQAFGESDRVIADRDGVLSQAQEQAARIVADAERRRDELVSDSDVHQLAKAESDRLRTEARDEADVLRRESDDYVDERLGTLEMVMSRTLEELRRGRERLKGRSDLGSLGADTDQIRLPEHDV